MKSRVNIITLYLEFNQMENILYTLALLFLWSCEQGLIPAFAYKCVLALRVFFYFVEIKNILEKHV